MQRVWIIVLSATTCHQFIDSAKYIPSLSGIRCLITDNDLLTTITFLLKFDLLGSFHYIIDRGERHLLNPSFLSTIGRTIGITRRHSCVYFDTNPGTIVSAQLQGWHGCLIAQKGVLKHPEYKQHRSGNLRVGRGLWYTTRFKDMQSAIQHFLFGSNSLHN